MHHGRLQIHTKYEGEKIHLHSYMHVHAICSYRQIRMSLLASVMAPLAVQSVSC